MVESQLVQRNGVEWTQPELSCDGALSGRDREQTVLVLNFAAQIHHAVNSATNYVSDFGAIRNP